MKEQELFERYRNGERNFQKSNLEGSRLFKANLDGSDFSDSNLFNADWANCSLVGVNFNGANLWKVRFSNCDLRGANLGNIGFINASFDHSIYDENTIFPGRFDPDWEEMYKKER